MFRNDLVFYFGVRSGRDDFLGQKLRLIVVRPPVHNLLGISLPNTRKRSKLFGCCRVDVKKIARGGRRGFR